MTTPSKSKGGTALSVAAPRALLYGGSGKGTKILDRARCGQSGQGRALEAVDGRQRNGVDLIGQIDAEIDLEATQSHSQTRRVVQLVLSTRLQRAEERLARKSRPDLVIGIQPGADSQSNNRRRMDEDVLTAKMRLVGIVDTLIVEAGAFAVELNTPLGGSTTPTGGRTSQP